MTLSTPDKARAEYYFLQIIRQGLQEIAGDTAHSPTLRIPCTFRFLELARRSENSVIYHRDGQYLFAGALLVDDPAVSYGSALLTDNKTCAAEVSLTFFDGVYYVKSEPAEIRQMA